MPIKIFKISPYRYYLKHSTNLLDDGKKENLRRMIIRFFSLKDYQLLLNDEIPLSLYQKYKLEYFINKIKNNYPLEYLFNEVEFMSKKFYVDKRVLIPRIETQGLVELVLSGCGSDMRVLDVGTGSGNIPVSLVSYNSKLLVDALDISKKASVVAQKNFKNHGVTENVKIYVGDIAYFSPIKPYDILVTNPPYIDFQDVSMMSLDTQFEPKNALFAPNRGLGVIETIIHRLPQLLRRGGLFYLECGTTQCSMILKKIETMFESVRVEKDIFEKDRYVVGKGYLDSTFD